MDIYTQAIKTYWELYGENSPETPDDIFVHPETRIHTLRDDELATYSLDLQKVISSNTNDWFATEQQIFELSLGVLPSGGTLLDVGAGSGRISVAYMKEGFNVKAIDIAPELIDVCIQRGIDVELLDIKSATLRRNSYDGILCYLNVIPEISNNLAQLRNLVAKILRTLKRDGILVWSSIEWDMTVQENIDYVAEHGMLTFGCKMEYMGQEDTNWKNIYKIPRAEIINYFDNNKWEELYTVQKDVFYGIIFRKR